MKCWIILAAGIVLFIAIAVPIACPKGASPQLEVGASQGVVVLETEGSTGISVRMAEELAKVVNDGANRRLLPVVGSGSLQNIMDLKLLHGIDVAILQRDVLDYAKQQNLVPHIESWMTYITTLYQQEFHLIVRPEIKNISDLANQKVSVDVQGGGTAVTAARLFQLLGIAVSTTYDDPEEALEKLRRGEVAAVALVSGKPAPAFSDLIGENGLHFLSIPSAAATEEGYLPARLTAGDYPGLVPYNEPVDTVAVGTLLGVTEVQAGSNRYRNIANFVDAFFGGFGSLLQPGHHPKWQEVNLTAELPGWRRFTPAAQWLQHNAQIAAEPNIEQLKANFSRFMDERQQGNRDSPLSEKEKDQLFEQFKGWASARPALLQRPKSN
jgi:uncharacterized protein